MNMVVRCMKPLICLASNVILAFLWAIAIVVVSGLVGILCLCFSLAVVAVVLLGGLLVDLVIIGSGPNYIVHLLTEQYRKTMDEHREETS